MIASKPPKRLQKVAIPRQGVSAMTVCISAIAAKSKAIVCIADRALTYKGWGADTETDSGITKIIDLPGNWCAMFSGDSLTFPKRVLDRIAPRMKAIPAVTLEKMEEFVK